MRITEQDIIKIVCEYYDVDILAVQNTASRKKEIVKARQVSMFFIKEFNRQMILVDIGRMFAGRNGKTKDHATIIHADKTVKNQIKLYSDYRDEINNIRTDILNYEKHIGIPVSQLINQPWYIDSAWAENDYYADKPIRRFVYFVNYRFFPPNPYMRKGEAVTIRAYSGYREHSF
ncbi:MAG TPA: helix-turn-helix domain-containing protein [Bacteroidales bacterium]|nr:helix-turn-helix domain-containing protein [Bacteroidales bacterium]